jgi:D-methionine transport system substrate-binding protein
MQAGLPPKRDAIAIEDPRGPYVNILAIREMDRDKSWGAKLVAACHSPEVKQYIATAFDGRVIASW